MSIIQHKLGLSGRSGCTVEIIHETEKSFVRKHSKSPVYFPRLAVQIDKQKKFKQTQIFFAPKILGENNTGFDMEYIPGEKYSDFLIKLSKNELDKYLQFIVEFIELNLAKSSNEIIDSSIFHNKLNSLEQLLLEKRGIDELAFKVIENLKTNLPDASIPIGYCHGDFTFSNMVFCNNSIFLVDFLDSFIDSPLMDIVKLRQDTCFKWTVLIDYEAQDYKKNKTWQILDYFDQHLDQYFKNKVYYRNWYNFLQKLNLIRILPYLTEKKEIDIIITSLKSL